MCLCLYVFSQLLSFKPQRVENAFSIFLKPIIIDRIGLPGIEWCFHSDRLPHSYMDVYIHFLTSLPRLHGCERKSGQSPGNKAMHFLCEE